MKIDLHIERLLLDGFAANSLDGAAVRIALTSELTRLLQSAPPSSSAGSALPFLKTDALLTDTQSSAASLGAGVARALHGALGTTRPATPGTVR